MKPNEFIARLLTKKLVHCIYVDNFCLSIIAFQIVINIFIAISFKECLSAYHIQNGRKLNFN